MTSNILLIEDERSKRGLNETSEFDQMVTKIDAAHREVEEIAERLHPFTRRVLDRRLTKLEEEVRLHASRIARGRIHVVPSAEEMKKKILQFHK